MQMSAMEDFYEEAGRIVFSAGYHWKRGYCCGNGCRHCPYDFDMNDARPKVSISWSGGKDSAFALHKIISEKKLQVVSLHTVIDSDSGTVGLHGIPEMLIEKQSKSMGLPLEKIYMPASESLEFYTSLMKIFYDKCADEKIVGVVFGDIFLQDLRDFKANLLKSSGLTGYFPLWHIDTRTIFRDFFDVGFKTKICAARSDLFSKERLGVVLDDEFLNNLIPEIDPCGENGEFHTFVYDGPIFREQIELEKTDVREQSYTYNKRMPDGKVEEVKTSFWFQNFRA
jgi:uncharacterized protein (TIGR00290 family)